MTLGKNTRILFALLAIQFLSLESHAAPSLRLTTWYLRWDENAPNEVNDAETITNAADMLRKLNADVIVLENVRDRESCQSLVDALKPANYQIAACSSFRYAQDGKKIKQQVAILSKTKAALGWSESWQVSGEIQPLPGGFAFAEVHKDNMNVGLLAIHLGHDETLPESADGLADQPSRLAATDQLLKTIATFNGWNSNRIDTVVVAGDLQAVKDTRSERNQAFANLAKNGFVMALDWLPRQNSSLVDFIFTRGAGPIGNVVFSSVENSPVQPVTCDVSLEAPRTFVVKSKPEATPKTAAPALVSAQGHGKPVSVISNGVAPTTLARTETNPKPEITKSQRALANNQVQTPAVAQSSEPKAVILQPLENQNLYWRLAEIFVIGMVTFAVIWKILFPKKLRTASNSLIRREVNPGIALAEDLSPQERAGVVSHLTLWLKQKFVHRMVTDRQQLLLTQQAAALAVMAIDERLTNVEKQIKLRNQEYEQRIEELLKELAVAQEENRELIKSKIEMLKLEIAKSNATAKSLGFPSRN